MSELKLCPFCGGVAEIIKYKSKSGWRLVARCTDCLAQARAADCDVDDEEDIKRAENYAKRFWNRRYEI